MEHDHEWLARERERLNEASQDQLAALAKWRREDKQRVVQQRLGGHRVTSLESYRALGADALASGFAYDPEELVGDDARVKVRDRFERVSRSKAKGWEVADKHSQTVTEEEYYAGAPVPEWPSAKAYREHEPHQPAPRVPLSAFMAVALDAAKLSPMERTSLVETVLEGNSVQEVARQYGLSSRQVRDARTAALRKLARSIAELLELGVTKS